LIYWSAGQRKILKENIDKSKVLLYAQRSKNMFKGHRTGDIEINSLIPEIKYFKDFQKDLKTKGAVERNIEIIGEAMSRDSMSFP
jgi:hypothetical protein